MSKSENKNEEVKEEKVQEIKLGKVNNKVDKDAKEEYKALCDFTTVKYDKKGNQISAKVSRNDVITAQEVPFVWIEQAVSMGHAVLLSDLKTESKAELKKRGIEI